MTKFQKTLLGVSVLFLFLGLMSQNILSYIVFIILLVLTFIVGRPLKRTQKESKKPTENKEAQPGNTLDQRLKSIASTDTENHVSNKMSGYEQE